MSFWYIYLIFEILIFQSVTVKSISEKKSQKNVKRSLRSPEETIVNDPEGEYSNEAKKFKPEIEVFSRSL